MKRIYRYIFAAIAIASAAACAEQMEDNQLVQGQPSAGLSTMTFSASIEENIVSKTTYNNQSVLWEATDAITVFSMGESVKSSDFTVTTLAEVLRVATRNNANFRFCRFKQIHTV